MLIQPVKNITQKSLLRTFPCRRWSVKNDTVSLYQLPADQYDKEIKVRSHHLSEVLEKLNMAGATLLRSSVRSFT